MRTSFLLLSAALLLAACDDAAETTAPRSRSIVTSPAAQASPVPNAKPLPEFTSVTSVESAQNIFGGAGNIPGWLTSGTTNMTCPAGTQVIGGGYDFAGTSADLHVHASKPNGANGWAVRVENTGSPSSVAYVKVTAVCIK